MKTMLFMSIKTLLIINIGFTWEVIISIRQMESSGMKLWVQRLKKELENYVIYGRSKDIQSV